MKILCLYLLLILALPWPGKAFGEEKSPWTWDWNLLWGASQNGQWKEGAYSGDLSNRLDFRLHLPWKLSLRTQLIDRRPFGEESGLFSPGGGIYHGPTGSRFLYGVQDEYGLSARIRNVWAKGMPFAEARRPSSRDLKTGISSTKRPETSLYLGSPELWIFRGFASLGMDEDLNPALGTGLEARWDANTLALEGFYTGAVLSPRSASSWFSLAPPLPERDFRVFALCLIFNSPFLALSSDWAYSETFAYGRDMYGNLGLRLGDLSSVQSRHWRLSLAVDGAGGRFVGSDGGAPGAGFRAAARLERRGAGSSLFRLGTTMRSPGWGEGFERTSSQVYYRFPLNARIRALPLRLSRLFLTLNRDARDREKTSDRAEAGLALVTGTLGWTFTGQIGRQIGVADDSGLNPFPLPDLFSQEGPLSTRLSGELSWSPRKGLAEKIPGALRLKTKLTYSAGGDKAGLWEPSFYASLGGKLGRFSFKITPPEIQEDQTTDTWKYSLSWRLEK